MNAQEAKQHRLRLVGTCVAQGDAIQCVSAQKLGEIPAAFVAGGFFQVLASLHREAGDIHLSAGKRKAELNGEVFDKPGVLD